MQFDGLGRREFITLLGAGAAWPLVARAQQPKMPTIGYLGVSTRSAQSQWIDAWLQRLRELGWVDGRNLAIEYRFAEGRSERFSEIAAEFVRLRVDVIFTPTTPPALAAKQATSVIPIVCASASDPVGSGLVASLARPGGNVTGIANDALDVAGKRVLVGKRIELLKEVVPVLRRLGIMANVDNLSVAQAVGDAQEAASKLGVEVTLFPIRRAEDIEPAFEGLTGRVDALFIPSEALVFINRTRISTLALAARLPTLCWNREQVEAGGLMSYGPSTPDLLRRGAEYVDRVLRGAKPAGIPVAQQ